MPKRTVFIFVVFCSVLRAGPYAPPANQTGSTAIPMNDPRIIAWATGAVIERGFVNISKPELGYVSFGNPANCLGPAQGGYYNTNVISLGDGGIATVTFQRPITNGDGYDFVVFENSYSSTFLELGFVEVSSDGSNFFRFNAVSLTDPNTQVNTFGSVDATNINNLAGKYKSGYGTPFDLQELAGIEGLDINSIAKVRIIDVVGCIQSADFNNDGFVDFSDYSILAGAYPSTPQDVRWNPRCDIAAHYDVIDGNDVEEFLFQWLEEWSSMDCLGNKINDPWPTPFDVGGFDLDAVGVIHQTQP
ncbi:MAG: T9SS C-terminal target domain-containing protein [Phycisphaerae bacterium]|nr:T9SS C-terminal target domain-containing protein [Phycisphaerae bacterium]